ncbi:MAG: DUF72 domain-containing protein [Desulfurococcales archaeon]|nr:DUF72 domain-containing protein [Desulfurococcales archaeon]
MDIRVGVCGLPRKIEVISEKLDVIEIQETFYKPKPSKYLKWKERASNLEFTVKVWFLITHGWNKLLVRKAKLLETTMKINKDRIGGLKPTEENFMLLEEVIKAARGVNAKLLVFQTPGSFKPVDVNGISHFLTTVVDKGFTPIWEVRGATLDYEEELARITEKTTGLVLSTDMLRSLLPVEYRSELVYIRLHGLGGRQVNYRYKYTKDDLRELLNRIVGYMESKDKTTSYVMFNNIYMFGDAVSFKSILEQLNLGK